MHIFTYHQCPTQIGNWDETTGIIDCMHGSVVSWLTKTTDRSDPQPFCSVHILEKTTHFIGFYGAVGSAFA